MFDHYTPDTFQPKLLGIAHLVAEACQISELIDKREAWKTHLRSIQEEIGDRLERGFERNLCSDQQLSDLHFLQKGTYQDVLGISRNLLLGGLPEQLESNIFDAFHNLDFSLGKQSIDKHLTLLGTHAFSSGYSKFDCEDISTHLYDNPNQVRDWILDSRPISRKYLCVIAINIDKLLRNNIYAAVKAVFENAGVKEESAKLLGLKNNPGRIYFSQERDALRASLAISEFQSEIRARLNVVALYFQRPAPQIETLGWVKISGRFHETSAAHGNSLNNLHPRRNAKLLSVNAVEALHNRHEPAVEAALDLHNLALNAMDDRLRLVTMWSALEALTSVVEGNSVMERIENTVVPIVTWRKIGKLVSYAGLNIQIWLSKNPDLDRHLLPFGLGHNNRISAEQLLIVFAKPNKHSDIKSLLKIAGEHPLLVHRIFGEWKTFTDPKELSKNLEYSQKTLSRHLLRIYRCRNLLVHHGIETPNVSQLANHLQQYFSWTLSRVIDGMRRGDEWTSRDSFYFWRLRADYVLGRLKDRKGFKKLVAEDFLPGELNRPQTPVWE